MADRRLDLASVISALREKLLTAQAQAEGQSRRLQLGEATVGRPVDGPPM